MATSRAQDTSKAPHGGSLQEGAPLTKSDGHSVQGTTSESTVHSAAGGHSDAPEVGHEGGHEGGHKAEPRGTFDAHYGTWFNWLSRPIFDNGEPVGVHKEQNETHFSNVKHDYMVVSFLIMIALAVIGLLAAHIQTPEGVVRI